ncbi:sigma-54-dependent Fis family transcriptional regulator [Amaricoccus solimangrovi]|uniref:GAF domain-containing protein n=1 Tax=Amaricoccus solimangrovi TaxID=2589815 RepID=A0A501WN91_9RHOB|nr:helix-turn-helix domain-containing protein [Amaricoccus solimangrovi]TPE50788.1 GAF domain-containing protein [Amaricoccus solimangrovi]
MGRASESVIDQARNQYFGEGRLPSDQLGHAVLRSWIRCSDMGLRERVAPSPDPLSSGDLRHLHDRHARFCRLCRPELEMLGAEARDTGSVVILTDAAGMILDTLGDTAFAGRAARVALRPGVDWSEASTGTNAIGVALAERRPVAVHGGEHFFADHQLLSCSATPIMDPRGAIMGVLDISGSSGVSHTHALGLVRMAVSQIEHRLLRQRFDGCRVLRFHGDPGMLGTVREGALIFREETLVAGNRRGLALAGLGWDALDRTRFEQIFALPAGAARSATTLRGPKGETFVCEWRDAETGAPTLLAEPEAPAPRETTLHDAETDLILRTLRDCGGNVSEAARRLGIHRSTIHRRVAATGRPHPLQ